MGQIRTMLREGHAQCHARLRSCRGTRYNEKQNLTVNGYPKNRATCSQLRIEIATAWRRSVAHDSMQLAGIEFVFSEFSEP